MITNIMILTVDSIAYLCYHLLIKRGFEVVFVDFLVVYLCLYLFYSFVSFLVASGLYSIYKSIDIDVNCILQDCIESDREYWETIKIIFLEKSELNMTGRLRKSIKKIVGTITIAETIEEILSWPIDVIIWCVNGSQAIYIYRKIYFYMYNNNIVRKID